MDGRTSITHPLLIAEVSAGPSLGRVGLTFCPGKRQSGAVSGSWARDLGLDLDAIEAWGAAAVVTLVEQDELEQLGVVGIGAAVANRHMSWFHLPITDVSTPESRFEEEWAETGAALRAILRSGFDVLIHCKGGLGRAGMISARLLVELGWAPDDAIAAVRRERPGAIETSAQEAHVRAQFMIEEPERDQGPRTVRDRAIGCLLGLAVGDAVGTTLEFKRRDSYPRLTDMVGGGPFGLEAGQWTDDTAMALALGHSLVAQRELDEHDLMTRFVAWCRRGEYSCTSNCFDIGITTRDALARFESCGDPIAGSTDPQAAGNGSLMRLAPVVLNSFVSGPVGGGDIARRQSATTHGAPVCLDACEQFSFILYLAMSGRNRSFVFQPRERGGEAEIARSISGSWRGARREQIKSTGYVAHSLEAALWCVGRTASFRDAVLLAANLGDDADTTAAITGQLAGALYGKEGIPSDWLEKLAWRDTIEELAVSLFENND